MLVLLPAQHKFLADKVQLAQVRWLLKPLFNSVQAPLHDKLFAVEPQVHLG